MNWKRQVIKPFSLAVVFTIASFLAVMAVAAFWTAIWIWGLGNFEPKWGNQWGNFVFSIQIFSIIAGVFVFPALALLPFIFPGDHKAQQPFKKKIESNNVC